MKCVQRLQSVLPSLSHLFLFSLLISTLCACGKESLVSEVDRKKDHEHEATMALMQDYKQVEGSYRSSEQDASDYRIEADLQVVPIAKDGFITPQPSVAGAMRIWEKKSSRVAPMVFQFSNGTYDAGSGQFAAKIAGINTDGIQISCKRLADASLDCWWMSATSTSQRFEFFLAKL